MRMAWSPWARSNLRPDELIDWLRYRAIEFKAPPAFIDGIEELYAYSTQDEALFTNAVIRAAFEDYIKKLHVFYRLRDGPNGVLSGRGL